MKTWRIFALIVAVAVGTVVVTNGPFLYGPVAAPRQTPASAHVNSPDGLRLTLSLDSSTVMSGQPVTVEVSETNTLSSQLNISSSSRWPTVGLRTGSCYASVYPFGFALFSGRYTQANLSGAAPLQVFPAVPCPLFMRLVTGYLFEAGGGSAVILPGTGPATLMAVNATITGTYDGASSGGAQPLPSGTYTVVAGDEWGAVVFLYLDVR